MRHTLISIIVLLIMLALAVVLTTKPSDLFSQDELDAYNDGDDDDNYDFYERQDW